MALQAYRHLLRSTWIAFQGSSLLPSLASQPKLYKGDIPLLHAARAEARKKFRENASLQPSDSATAAAIKHAEEVALVLKQNVVQGKKIDGDRYKLRIHEHTERGDNDTVKMPNGQKIVIDGKTCADR